MTALVGVDWGTSSLRVARLDSQGHAIDQREFPRGILTVEAGGFASVFEQACGDWMKAAGALALVCGMAGSRQGWHETPYAHCPAGFAEIASKLAWIEPDRIAIVPGLTCESAGVPDVMRGEETKALGVMKLLARDDASIVMPGTHCKWVRVRAGRIESFATFMTGEFYSVLRRHSILARTMDADDDGLDPHALRRGIDQALQAGTLLHAAFSARTLSLFEKLPADAAPSYLSGLLIGEELRTQNLAGRQEPLVLVGAPQLTRRYGIAFEHLGVPFRAMGQEATWLGLAAIAQSLETSQ